MEERGRLVDTHSDVLMTAVCAELKGTVNVAKVDVTENSELVRCDVLALSL